MQMPPIAAKRPNVGSASPTQCDKNTQAYSDIYTNDVLGADRRAAAAAAALAAIYRGEQVIVACGHAHHGALTTCVNCPETIDAE
jgi:hypothetical protein